MPGQPRVQGMLERSFPEKTQNHAQSHLVHVLRDMLQHRRPKNKTNLDVKYEYASAIAQSQAEVVHLYGLYAGDRGRVDKRKSTKHADHALPPTTDLGR